MGSARTTAFSLPSYLTPHLTGLCLRPSLYARDHENCCAAGSAPPPPLHPPSPGSSWPPRLCALGSPCTSSPGCHSSASAACAGMVVERMVVERMVVVCWPLWAPRLRGTRSAWGLHALAHGAVRGQAPRSWGAGWGARVRGAPARMQAHRAPAGLNADDGLQRRHAGSRAATARKRRPIAARAHPFLGRQHARAGLEGEVEHVPACAWGQVGGGLERTAVQVAVDRPALVKRVGSSSQVFLA